ncbi:lytic transglycosylase catalytic [Pantoea agglomerans]|uniref:lytic transglycosylase catalytic n=1 Tax=Enterobacter agglomerans TaxID=549 RepID=UPI0013C5542E|nr:lytic transglycosylase catalytic [Pantoea agglomerans]NEG57959.1 lytic transglycosylase catalytic [Pantoea agglomerans]NEH04365.1 lytic transglycosylase catalytic [Pantoea agglomerans]NEH14232.1 lytic transglycosylase catalytic [Pantoea agglomerans]
MNAETIKDFLVSLGFQIDDAGARKFDSVVLGTTLQVVKLGAAVEATALTVVAFTAKIASGLDNLYWMSQRTGATVNGIRQIGYAVSQMGGSVEAARGSLESLSRFMRNNPGSEGFLNRLGVQTRDASGNMRDMASIFTGVGEKLSNMPYYRANQYAQMLGIDENTLMAMRRGLGQFNAQYTQMAKAIGFNADQAAISSNKFMTSLRAFGQMAGMARDKIGSSLAEGLSGSIDTLRKQIVDNFPKIEQTITSGVKGILWMAEVIGRVVYRLIQAAGDIREWWNTLDKSTQQLIETLGALVLAWKLVNSAFLTSPIGRIIALGLAILSLYDDYKTWQAGGKSLIDWEKWQPGIDSAKKALDWFTDKLNKLNNGTLTWKGTLQSLSDFMKGDWSKSINDAIASVNRAFGGFLTQIGQKFANSPFWKTLQRLHVVNEKDTQDMLNFFSGEGGKPPGPTATDKMPGEDDGPEAIYPVDGPASQYAQSLKRGERNNNPGNLNYAGQAGAMLERSGGRFAKFQSAYDGLRAMARQLMLYAKRGINSVEGIISTWAPSSENNTGAYVNSISSRLGVDPKAALNLQNPQVLSQLMNGIIHHENGRNIYSSELVSRAASGAASPTVNQETNIHIHGVSDPERAGSSVAERQMGVNSRLTQQLTPAVR